MKTYKNIPWYGPAYLYSNYGNIGSVQNASTVANGTYTVQGGDTLSKILINVQEARGSEDSRAFCVVKMMKISVAKSSK